MTVACANAGLTPEQVDYVNAHGTATPQNDATEAAAINHWAGGRATSLPVSSTKANIGHLLGAAGAVEAVFTTMAIVDKKAPPTINYETPDPELDLDYVPNEARTAEVRVALSNAMGLGGHNGCVLFGRV